METLKRELNKTYLVFSDDEGLYEASYELQMITRNQPETILPLQVMHVDGEIQLCYEVTAKQTLADCAEREKLTKETVRRLFEAIDRMLREVRDYLLEAGCVVLDPKHIYTREGEFYFCYCPWQQNNILESMRGLLENILGKLDYHDSKGVELAYHLYQCACKGTLLIDEILREHCQEPAAEENVLREDPGVYAIREMEERQEACELKKNEKEKKQKGVLSKVLQFFLKKEDPEAEEGVQKEESTVYEELWTEEAVVKELPENSRACEKNTILMDRMEIGGWRLQPQSSDYPVFFIREPCFVVGKKRSAVDGCIERSTISRIHSRLFLRQGRLFVADANSTNGTFVNGEAVEPGREREIYSGDRILFADVAYECYNSL